VNIFLYLHFQHPLHNAEHFVSYGSLFLANMSDEVLVWLSVWSRCRLFAYGPADATAVPKLIVSCLILKVQTGFTFLVPAYPGCPGKEVIKWE